MEAMGYYHQGVDLAAKGNYDAAIEVFNTGLAEYPDSYSLLDRRADAYKRKGEHDKAIADYTRMTTLKPQNPDGWNYRGLLYRELGEYDKAIADFTQCIPLSPEGYGAYWSNRGIAYYEKGDFNAALADLNKSIEVWKDPAATDWALVWRGHVWRKRGNLNKAIKDFTLAATRNPHNDGAFAQAGYIWFEWQNDKKAIECFSAAIALRDDDANHWLARGVCYWNICRKNKTGFWDEGGEMVTLADDDFSKAIECSPDMAAAYFNRGVVRCFKAVESNRLIQQIAIQKASDKAEQAAMLSKLELMGGKDLVPDAAAVLRGVDSSRDEAGMVLGECAGLVAEKESMDALEDLCRAIELDPGNVEAYHQRGIVYALTGKRDEALADYDHVCAMDPNHRKAAERRKKLLKLMDDNE
jgi:tetratricopeptide (TPR) repeat protein